MNKKKKETLVSLLREYKNEVTVKEGRSAAVDGINFLLATLGVKV